MWLQANKLTLNVAKTEYMLILSRQRLAKLPLEPNICIGSYPIKRVRDTKILGVYIDESLTWSKHIDEITKKITAGISALKRLRDFGGRDVLVSVYNALIMPHFDYCCEVWDSFILVPRGRAPFGQHQESRSLAWSNDIPFLNGFVNTTD